MTCRNVCLYKTELDAESFINQKSAGMGNLEHFTAYDAHQLTRNSEKGCLEPSFTSQTQSIEFKMTRNYILSLNSLVHMYCC